MYKEPKEPKVKIDHKVSGYDSRNPLAVLDYLDCTIWEDKTATFMRLKELLKSTPWTLDDLRSFAASGKHPYFTDSWKEIEENFRNQQPETLAIKLHSPPIGRHMTNKKAKKPKATKSLPEPKRDFTLEEQARVEKLRERRSARPKGSSDVFRPQGESCEYAVAEGLSFNDGREELAARTLEATGLTEFSNATTFLCNMTTALLKKGASTEDQVKTVNSLSALLREFEPKDAVEGMLAAQAVVSQQKAFDLIHSSSIQPHVEWARQHSQFANKLLVRSQAAIEALIKYRRGGQQKVIVEHVHVHSGGRAIVGHVENNPGGGGDKNNNIGGTP